MGRTQRAVLGLLFLAVCTYAQSVQQQPQMVAPGPATTFTNMAEQVAELSTFPNTPATQRTTVSQTATQLQLTGGANNQGVQAQRGQAQQYQWAPQAAPAAQNGQGGAAQQSTGAAQQPPYPNQPPRLPANGPAPNPQGTINTIGSVVQAAGSLASAQQALSSAGTAAGSGDILQTVGSAAQALQAVQKAAGDVGNAQKSIQTNGEYVASPAAATVPSPPTININVPGLGGNGGVQGPPGISYTAPATQGTAYGAQQQAGAQPSDPLSAIGSALAQAAFGGGLNQPAASSTLQAKSPLGRKFA